MRLREHPAIGEGRTDILAADPRQLSIIENYNVRDITTPDRDFSLETSNSAALARARAVLAEKAGG